MLLCFLKMNTHYHRSIVPLLLRVTSLHTSNILMSRHSFTLTNTPEDFGTTCLTKEKKSFNKSDVFLDSFTDKLLQESVSVSESKRIQVWTENFLSKLNIDDIFIKFIAGKSNVSQLHLLRQYLESCVNEKSLPDPMTRSVLLHIFAKSGCKESVYILKNLCSKYNEEEYIKEGCYDHFLGEALWRSGNIERAVNLFWNVYEKNSMLRSKIRSMLKVLVIVSIPEKGESVLNLLIKLSEKFISYYSDYTLLSYIWEACFLSKWHSDNLLASSLLEKYPELKNYVSLQVYHLSSTSLATHELDTVQRLFEILLKYDMKKEYEIVLRSLFDYAYSRRDVTACSAIIQSTHELDVTLTEAQHTKYLFLFSEHVPKSIRKTETPKFQFKF